MSLLLAAGLLLGVASMACPPPSSESDQNAAQATRVQRARADDPAPGTIDCMGTPDLALQAAAQSKSKAVPTAEAPGADHYTDAALATVPVSSPAGATLKELAAAIGKGAEREVFVDWARLNECGMKEDSAIEVPLARVACETALRIVNERLGRSGVTGRLAVRRTGDLVEVSTQETFDRREQKTVAYDLRPLLSGLVGAARDERVGAIMQSITSTIEPEGWADMGGATARYTTTDGRVFVVAPPRYQQAVAWMLGQISGTGAA